MDGPAGLIIDAALALALSFAGTWALGVLLPGFRSHEVKPGAHQLSEAAGVSSKLPLVGGPAAWIGCGVALAVLGATRAGGEGWWLLAGMTGFFVFGLADDVRKTRAGRGVAEGPYLLLALALAIAATALLVGPGAHAMGAASPFALAHWLGATSQLPLSAWYLALIVGTALATSFSDGMDGLTSGTVSVAAGAAAVAVGLSSGITAAAWPALIAATSLGVLPWNLPSRWSPSARARRRRARAYLGDSGALMLGAGAAMTAIVAGVDLLWPIIAAPLLLEGFSSLLQAKVLVPVYRRLRDPRLPDGRPLPHQRFPLPLLASPLHYHWEHVGLDRRSITLLFWFVSVVTGACGVLAVAMPTRPLAALWLGLGAAAAAAFWGVAMWLRPAFLLREGDRTVLAHGRPLRLGPLPLFRRRTVVGGPELAAYAARQRLLEQPMNAHELDEIITTRATRAEPAE